MQCQLCAVHCGRVFLSRKRAMADIGASNSDLCHTRVGLGCVCDTPGPRLTVTSTCVPVA